jgi:hypothetical protein
MNSTSHYFNNQPLSIYNLYKYLSNLYKLNIIPSFEVDICDNLENIIFTFYYKYGTSQIKYNIHNKKWRSLFNTISFERFLYECNKYYYYIIINKDINISRNNDYIMLESSNIDDILEPSLNKFDSSYINIYSTNNIRLNNLIESDFYVFINKIMQIDYNRPKNALLLNYESFLHEFL